MTLAGVKDGRLVLCSGAEDGTIGLWCGRDYTQLGWRKYHTDAVLALQTDGRLLFSGEACKEVQHI